VIAMSFQISQSLVWGRIFLFEPVSVDVWKMNYVFSQELIRHIGPRFIRLSDTTLRLRAGAVERARLRANFMTARSSR